MEKHEEKLCEVLMKHWKHWHMWWNIIPTATSTFWDWLLCGLWGSFHTAAPVGCLEHIWDMPDMLVTGLGKWSIAALIYRQVKKWWTLETKAKLENGNGENHGKPSSIHMKISVIFFNWYLHVVQVGFFGGNLAFGPTWIFWGWSLSP